MTAELLDSQAIAGLFERVEREARHAGVRDVEVMAGERCDALTRFANNAIHQNVAERSAYVSVRIVENGRTARASTNRLDDDAIRAVVAEAIAITRASAADPALLPLPGPAPVPTLDHGSESTAASTPRLRAARVAEAIAVIESAGQTAAGIYSTSAFADALFNSAGVRVHHQGTLAVFSVTAMARDSSGWAKASAPDCNAIDAADLARRAAEKAATSASPIEIPPGRYTVILEPAAVLDLVGQMFPDFSATALADQRSFLTERLGSRLFGENVTIHDDVRHPLQAGAPWDGEGVPRQTLALVEAGVPVNVTRSRAAAARGEYEPTGHGFPLPNEAGEAPVNIVIAGGNTSVEQMIASTGRGVLVTRLWYIREVDPYEKIMTGMTRDGTFLIEDGQVARGVRNLRFNEGLVTMLGRVEALSPAVRASGEETFDMVVPAMKVADFNFTEVTRF